MRLVQFRAQALADVEDIADFISRDNPARALSFAKELEQRCHRIADQPRSGRRRPELGCGVRLVPYGRYVILYLEHDDSVDVLRVVHGARDLRRLV